MTPNSNTMLQSVKYNVFEAYNYLYTISGLNFVTCHIDIWLSNKSCTFVGKFEITSVFAVLNLVNSQVSTISERKTDYNLTVKEFIKGSANYTKSCFSIYFANKSIKQSIRFVSSLNLFISFEILSKLF